TASRAEQRRRAALNTSGSRRREPGARPAHTAWRTEMASSDGSPASVAAREAATAVGDAALALRMYRQMWRIRVFEGHANELYLTGKMPGLTHLYSGQEAVAVG